MTVSTAARYNLARLKLSVRTADPRGRDIAAAVQGDGLNEMRSRSFHHILFLIHGYNNSEQVAEDSYTLFTALLNEHLRKHPFDIDAIVNFHWPGNPTLDLKLLAPTIHYPYALLNARRAAALLANFLSTLLRPGPAPTSLKVSLVGHSMGCRLVMELLRTISEKQPPEFQCIGLMAAAVPVELVVAGSALFVPEPMNTRILKFFSPNDWVLRNFFPLGQKWSSLFSDNGQLVERRYYREAVGFDGNPERFAVNCPRRNNGHSDYWKDRKVVDKLLNKIDPSYAIPKDSWEIGSNVLEANEIAPHKIGR